MVIINHHTHSEMGILRNRNALLQTQLAKNSSLFSKSDENREFTGEKKNAKPATNGLTALYCFSC